MKEYKLNDEGFEYLYVNPRENVHRFCVQSIGGFKKYDRFTSLDDCFNFIIEAMRDDLLFLTEVEIFDMRSHIILDISNFKHAYRSVLCRMEK